MNEFLSPPETPKRSKSMSLHPTTDIDTRLIKQIGNYTLGAEVGSGAFGKVVLGKHYLTGETVAIKILDKMILSQTPEDYELVRQEISILKIVKHKYIVQLYEILQTPQHIFIVMEYCEGKDLMDYILTKTRLSELESLKFFQQLINALFYLHSQNISHRDVKIDNMLLDRNKNLKLVDFGLSTKYTDDTLLDQPCGTVVYAAPEVLDGNEYHGMLADVWSSGIVLFGMTSGFLPFCDQDDEVNKKHVLEGKIDIPEFFSPMLKDLLKHMLDINPITRYTLQDIREHPWFNLNDTNLIPGIIIGYNLIPVDENILNLCVAYNCDRDKIEYSVKNNKYDAGSALYYLLVRKITRKGFESVSDLSSDLFIDFILDDNNLVNKNKNNQEKKRIKSKDKTNKNKLNNINNSSTQINRNNSTNSQRTNTNHDTLENNRNDLTPYISNNKDIVSSSSRHIDDLGAAPRLYPQMNNNNNHHHLIKQKGKKGNLLDKKNRKNKVSSVAKNNQYHNKNSDDLNKKNVQEKEKKNKLKTNNAHIKINNNNDNNNKKRLNNSAQHRQTNFKNINKVEINKNNNKLKNSKINKNMNNNIKESNNNKESNTKESNIKESNIKENNNKESNNKESNIKDNNNLSKKQSNDISLNIKKEDSINFGKIEDNNLVLSKDESAIITIKGTSSDINEIFYKENNIKQEYNSNTEKVNKEIKNNKPKNNMNKTPIKTSKKSVTKDIKESTFSAYQDMSNKFKKKYEYNNKIKNQTNQNIENQKPKNKNKKEKNINNSSSINLNREKEKEKGDGYLGHSCLDMNPSDYLKTPISAKIKNNNGISNNNPRSSYKNINNNNKKKSINTNNTSSDKFNPKNYNNKTIYNKNKTHKNNHYISKSIHTTYNSKYNEMEKIEENTILFSSNKKKDYSLNRKKNNITSIHNLNHQLDNSENYNTKYKLYERNKLTFKNANITSPISKLNMSLNNNTSNKYNRYKYGIYSSVPKIKKQAEYDPNNTIYEINFKKNKNRIRLDFNPNKQYELTSNEIQDKKKKNKLNNSVTIGKTDEKKITRLTRYMNNYNRQYTKPTHLESSVITHRKMHSNTIRELSYSPNQKYLNEKTRKERIPWKIQKKGIDEKLASETIYNKYMNKINKRNPLKPYGNKKIKMQKNNLKLKRNNNFIKNNNIHNNTLKSIKVDTKLLNQTTTENIDNIKNYDYKNNKNILNKTNIQYNEKEIKGKNKEKDKKKNINKEKKINKHKPKCLSNENLPAQTHRLKINNEINTSSYLNNNFSDSINTINNKGYINGNFSITNSIPVSSVSSKKEIFLNMVNNKINIFDLSCIFINEKNIIDCYQNLSNKLKNNGFNIKGNKTNKIKCSKNNTNFEIDIMKINNNDEDKNDNKNENQDIYYYKINNKKGGFGVNKIISKVLLS